MSTKCIKWENVPCWYELSWQKKEPAIILRIHQDFIANTKVDFLKAPIVRAYKEDFSFADFGGDFNGDIGFNKVFKRRGEKDNFVEFVAEIPQVKKETNKKCKNCKGSGKDKILRDTCLYCDGSGKEDLIDWRPAFAISASFSVFLTLLYGCEKDTSAHFPQLLTVKTLTREEMHGGSLSGDISITLRKWLSLVGKNDDGQIFEMVQAMKTAYDRMFGLRDYDNFSFNVLVRAEGGFTADCPGDACGLQPSDWFMEEGEGYDFDCHNVDNPLQQLTLLAGLAAMHDQAKKEIKNY